MSKQRRAQCRQCGVSGNDEPISQAGYCPQCGAERMLIANAQLACKAGPAFEKWLARWGAAAERMSATHFSAGESGEPVD